jgi:choice-of-anchor A domain-containing protein
VGLCALRRGGIDGCSGGEGSRADHGSRDPGGNVHIGNSLAKDPARVDLIVGGDIAVTSGTVDVNSGSATYGGTQTGTVTVYQGGFVRNEAPPFVFSDEFERLRTLQDSWADAPGQLAPEIDPPRVRFVGTDDERNVFTIPASTLQSAEVVQIAVPTATSTTLINVTGARYTSADRPTERIVFSVGGGAYEQVGGGDTTSARAMARARLVWNFTDASVVQIGADTGNINWQGSVFAPRGTVVLARGATVYGAVIAQRLEQTGTARLPGIAAACLPPPCQPPVEPPVEPPTEPEPEPPPLPPGPITPSPPGASRPPEGGVAGEMAGSTAVALCKRTQRRRVPAGGRVTFRIEVRTTGPARKVVVCDRMPVGLTIVRARGATVRGNRACWRFGSVANERTVHLRARVNETASGRIRNVARVRAANARRARARAAIRVLAAPFDPCPPGAAAIRLYC